MAQTHDIRRHPDGSIDIDFYRVGAVARRRQAMRDTAALRKAFLGTLTMAGILSIVIAFAALPRPNTSLAIGKSDVSRTIR